jgi:uncharacterized protein YkwD
MKFYKRYRRNRFTLKHWIISIIIVLGLFYFAGEYEAGNLKLPALKIPEYDFSKVGNGLDRDEYSIEQRIFQLMNAERERIGRSPLRQIEKLNNYAKTHSIDMIQNNYFEHNDFNYNMYQGENIGETPIHYNVIGCGSTLTNDQIADCMFKGWMESPGHHENMIDSYFYMGGIGISCDSSKCKGTQTFARV